MLDCSTRNAQCMQTLSFVYGADFTRDQDHFWFVLENYRIWWMNKKTTSPRLEKDFGKTRDGQKISAVLSVTVFFYRKGLRDRQNAG